MIIKLLVEGGEMKPGPVLSQKLGPVGIPMNEVIQKVNEATKDFKGMKVPVALDINPSTKNFNVQVSSPPASELLKKELGIEKGSGEQKKMKVANASIEQIISVAKIKMPNLLSKDLKAAVKTILGSCVSLGVLVESKDPKEIEVEVDEGKYDREIKEGKTETPEEKKKKLEEDFARIKAESERLLKLEEQTEKTGEASTEESGEKKEKDEAKKESEKSKEESKKK